MTLTRDIKKLISELFFILSYFLIIVGIFRIFRSYIYNGDAFRIGLILHFLGVILGGHKLGGIALLRLIDPYLKKISIQVLIYLAWSTAWGILALIKHYGLHTGDFDVGIFGQTLLSLSQGKGYLQFPDVPWSYFGVHQNFTLPLFTPFFFTRIGTELLLFTQPFFLFSPALFFSIWINKYLRHDKYSHYWSWCAFYIFLTASTLTRNTLWEWHETVISYPALCLWMWALCFNKKRTFVIAGLIAGLTKENILISLIPGIILFPLVHYKSLNFNTRAKNILLFFLLAFFHLVIFVFERKFFSELNFSTLRYDWLGHSEKEILTTLLLKPGHWIPELFSDQRIYFLKSLIESSGFLGIFSGPYLIAWLTPLFTHILSNREAQYMIHYHYALEIWPLMAVSTLFVWLRGIQIFKNYKKTWLSICFCLSVAPVSENIFERYNQHLPDMKANFPVIQSIRKDLIQLKSRCHNQIRGMASQWTFAHFYQDIDNLYPVQSLQELKLKLEYEKVFLNKETKHCLFIIGEKKDHDLIIPELPHSFELKNTYEIKAWGNNALYELWVFTP